MLRLVQVTGVFTVAVFFTLVVVGNVFDPATNMAFVERVLMMDTTFKRPALMGRAITDDWAHQVAYYGIVVWEALAGLLAWIGFAAMLFRMRADAQRFDRAKRLATLGCLAGFLLYFLGFVVVGGEWFAMWQSKEWNGQQAAFRFAALIGFVLVFLLMREERRD